MGTTREVRYDGSVRNRDLAFCSASHRSVKWALSVRNKESKLRAEGKTGMLKIQTDSSVFGLLSLE